jgi:hypothetical protein
MTARPQHTPGLVEAIAAYQREADKCGSAVVSGDGLEQIATTINALAGLNPEAIPALIEAVERAIAAAPLPFDHPDKRDMPKILRAALAAVWAPVGT